MPLKNYVNIRVMKLNRDESGALNILLIPLIIAVLCFFVALGFGIWAYAERTDYKNNSDKKSEAAAAVASQKVSTQKDNEFLEKEKFPLDIYKAPAEFGSLEVSYPKTWSAYVSTEEDPFFIFSPQYVPAGDETAQALRIIIEASPYNDVISGYDGQIQDGKLKAAAYSLPKVPGVVGLKFDGELEEGKTASLVVLPLRDKTLKISSELPDRFNDFNNIILPNLVFSP